VAIGASCDRYRGPSPNLDQANPGRFQPFAALDDIRNNSLPFAEAREARPFKRGDVHEHVLAAAIPSDEAEALLDVDHFTVPGSSTDGPLDAAGDAKRQGWFDRMRDYGRRLV
jgi:hypothetical protein